MKMPSFITNWSLALTRVRSTFSVMPELYWRPLVLGLIALAFAVLAADTYIFWRYALNGETTVAGPDVEVERLDRGRYNTVLTTLKDRENAFNAILPK